MRENPGCTADSLPSLALDKPPTLPPTLSPQQAPSPTHPFPPPRPPPHSNPLVPGATICEFISALTALLSCHIASCTQRQSTITVLGLIIFHTPSFHLILKYIQHVMLPESISTYSSTESWAARRKLFALLCSHIPERIDLLLQTSQV